jgi:hypothetical protein
VADATVSGAGRWRRHLTVTFIVVWFAVQIAVPFVQKFDLEQAGLSYRYTRYSWAMFSRLVPRYEVTLFRTRGAGDREPIPDVGRYVRGYRSLDPMPMMAIYTSESEVLDRFARLVTAIAQERRDGYSYVASIRWTANRPGVSDHAELRADALP